MANIRSNGIVNGHVQQHRVHAIPTYFVRECNLRRLLYYNNDISLILYPALYMYIHHPSVRKRFASVRGRQW